MSAQRQRCELCGRTYLTHYSGTMRRHRCVEPAPVVSRTVRLRSGGTVTLRGWLDFATLGPRDRALVYWFIDAFGTYDQAKPSAVLEDGEEVGIDAARSST
jgi:hypothetical protein